MPTLPDKGLLIKVSQFLYDRRLYAPGVLEPIAVPLKDFRGSFGKSERQELGMDNLKELKKILLHIVEGRNQDRHPLLEIRNLEILNNLGNSYHSNKSIVLVYDKEDIRWYVDRLNSGLREMQAGADYNKLVFDPARRQFRYKDEVLRLRLNERTQSIRLNVCLLLYGEPLTYLDGRGQPVTIRSDITCEDYVLGKRVHFDVIKSLILDRGDMTTPEITRLSASQYKKITDALSDINETSEDKWGLKIFKYEGQEAWLLHP